MQVIYLKIKVQNIDFSSENFDTTEALVKEYRLSLSRNDTLFMNNLYTTAIRAKGDWISLDYDESLGTCFAELKLIFHDSKLNESDKEVLERTLGEIESYINSLNQKERDTNTTNIDKYVKLFEEEGFLVSLGEEGGSAILNHVEFEEFLSNQGIKFKRVALNEKWFDGGASGVSEGCLYFIIGAVSSGVTWDLIKFGTAQLFGGTIDDIKVHKFKKLKFNKLRKDIADKVKIDKDDLILSEMYKNNQDIIIVFKTGKEIINLITDINYNIVEMKVDEKP